MRRSKRLGEFGTAILNADDPYVAAMASKCKGRVLTFGMSPGAFVHASDVRTKGLNGVDFQLSCGGRSVAAHSPLPGQRLVYNALAAIAVGVSEGCRSKTPPMPCAPPKSRHACKPS